jgi:hypothetical protein
MKQTNLIKWLILATMIVSVSIFIYMEYFRDYIPERKKDYKYLGFTVEILNPNLESQPLKGVVMYTYKKGDRVFCNCRIIKSTGNIQYVDVVNHNLKLTKKIKSKQKPKTII